VNIDQMGKNAAHVLRDATEVDTERALASLKALDKSHPRRHQAALLTVAALIAASFLVARPFSTTPHNSEPEPPVSTAFAPLGAEYTVIDRDVSVSGAHEVVAALREGLPSIVLVRDSDSLSPDVVWTSPTEHEHGGTERLPTPAAVRWAPDESQIAILMAEVRKQDNNTPNLLDLSVVLVNRDGTGRHLLAQVGTCRCETAPIMTWSDHQLTVSIPDGPDRGKHTEEMP
jgi:hypothetical protein